MAVTYVRSAMGTSDLVATVTSHSELMNEMAVWETPLLAMIGLDSLTTPCKNSTHYYLEMPWKPNRSTLNGGINNSTQTITLSNEMFKASDIVQIGTEQILLGTTSNNLTFSNCTRSYGTAAAAAHSDGDTVRLIASPAAQGASLGSSGDLVTMPSQVTTYTQIFERFARVTGTANVIQRYGRMDVSEMDYQVSQHLKEILVQMQSSILFGVGGAPSGTSTAGKFDGIYERSYGGAVSLSSAAITVSQLQDDILGILEYGRPESLAYVCSNYSARVLDSLAASKEVITIPPADAGNAYYVNYGVRVQTLFLCGVQIAVIPCQECQDTGVEFLVRPDMLHFGPLRSELGSREIHSAEIASTGDYDARMIVGEYTFECPGAASVHIPYTNVKTS